MDEIEVVDELEGHIVRGRNDAMMVIGAKFCVYYY